MQTRLRENGTQLISRDRDFVRIGILGSSIVVLMLFLLLAGTTNARTLLDPSRDQTGFSTGNPTHCLAAHRVGRIELAVANNGTIGVYYFPGAQTDWFTGQPINHSCQYPKGSNVVYLYGGAFWIGAVVGRDTLVSVGADGWQQAYEMYPAEGEAGEMIYRSIRDPNSQYYKGAVSEEDYISVYTDTRTDGIPNDYFGHQHKPLNIEVKQASYAWSYSYAEDFVLFDYKIKNMGDRKLEDVYMGIYVDCMVCFDCFGTGSFIDDHTGFLQTYPGTYGDCEYEDTVFIAWIADDDGDPDLVHGDGKIHPCPHVSATRIVRTPSKELDVSFNWWIGNGSPSLDFGPREREKVGRRKELFRDFRTGGLGTPEGDVNKYYVLSNQEFDYSQVYTASIQANDPLWIYPNQNLAEDFADGYDTRYLLSFGPFDISSGQTLPISFAYLIGEDLHRVPGNKDNLPHNPDAYLANLDFSDLAKNAVWAGWIYDNPGVDTDGDGYFGEAHVCATESTISIDTISGDTFWVYDQVDSIFYLGDGVPDFRGAAPPPAPKFWVIPGAGSIRIRFNGTRSETEEDLFLHQIDFEGYRIYVARDEREESYSLVASWDKEDFSRYVYNPSENAWVLAGIPQTLEELRALYGDPELDPLDYSRTSPYTPSTEPGTLVYFVPQDYNASEFGLPGTMRKLYPDQSQPTSDNPDSAGSNELTDDGYLKYYEYEYVLENLLPTVAYWVNVTAFDFGSPETGLESLESSVTLGAQSVYPRPQDYGGGNLDGHVVVYPNPYRFDANSRRMGFEGRAETDRPDDRVRAIHFSNLPARCTIRIFTLDGDLVQEIVHERDVSDPNSTHDSWNLITRNGQMVVSGLYYWTVESREGEVQMGKLAIIM